MVSLNKEIRKYTLVNGRIVNNMVLENIKINHNLHFDMGYGKMENE